MNNSAKTAIALLLGLACGAAMTVAAFGLVFTGQLGVLLLMAFALLLICTPLGAMSGNRWRITAAVTCVPALLGGLWILGAASQQGPGYAVFWCSALAVFVLLVFTGMWLGTRYEMGPEGLVWKSNTQPFPGKDA